MGRLEGKVAAITGGAMGMGAGCAQVFAKENAVVNIVDFNAEKGEAMAQSLRDAGYTAKFFQADVRDENRLAEIYQAIVDEFGHLDILVNAAGRGDQRSFLKADKAYLDSYMDVNFGGIWNSCHAAIPHMLKQQYGKIVNFASVTGIMVVDPCMTVYAATKGAIMALTKSLAVEFAGQGITVNAILPGMIDTPMTRASCAEANPENPQSIMDAMAAQIPMGRLGTAEEAGKTCLFLASDDSSYVTGTSIVFDGGNTIPENPGCGWEPQED